MLGEDGKQLDHAFSQKESFKRGVLPYYIGHYCNLRLIDADKNIRKGTDCLIPLDELINRVNYYDEKNKGTKIN